MSIKKLKLLILANFVAISTANAGLPVLEATSTIFMPLSYLEQLQTQLNTLAEYEQMILDYENQFRQLEYMTKNFDIEQYKFTNLTELRSRLDMFKNQYLDMANKYNEFADKTNRIQDDYCRYSDKLEICQQKMNDLLEQITEANQKEIENQAKERNTEIEGTIANLFYKDAEKIKELSEKTNNRNTEKDGTNQILSDNRNQLQLLNQQILNLRNQQNKQYFEDQNKKISQNREVIEHKKYIEELQKRSLDYKRKTYKDKF